MAQSIQSFIERQDLIQTANRLESKAKWASLVNRVCGVACWALPLVGVAVQFLSLSIPFVSPLLLGAVTILSPLLYKLVDQAEVSKLRGQASLFRSVHNLSTTLFKGEPYPQTHGYEQHSRNGYEALRPQVEKLLRPVPSPLVEERVEALHQAQNLLEFGLLPLAISSIRFRVARERNLSEIDDNFLGKINHLPAPYRNALIRNREDLPYFTTTEGRTFTVDELRQAGSIDAIYNLIVPPVAAEAAAG